jgi:hypothetical protein
MREESVDAFSWLALLTGYLVAALIGLIGLIVVWNMYTGKIDLRWLISEGLDGGHDASLSRFQFLVFTFVIALSLLLMVVAQLKNGGNNFSFPDLKNAWAL